jgi:hypothetical protein
MTVRPASTPPELEAAMRAVLDANSSPTAPDLLGAAERLLDKVLSSDCESRSSALDLLTVDALITRALSEAANDPATLGKFATDAMRRLASHNKA